MSGGCKKLMLISVSLFFIGCAEPLTHGPTLDFELISDVKLGDVQDNTTVQFESGRREQHQKGPIIAGALGLQLAKIPFLENLDKRILSFAELSLNGPQFGLGYLLSPHQKFGAGIFANKSGGGIIFSKKYSFKDVGILINLNFSKQTQLLHVNKVSPQGEVRKRVDAPRAWIIQDTIRLDLPMIIIYRPFQLGIIPYKRISQGRPRYEAYGDDPLDDFQVLRSSEIGYRFFMGLGYWLSQ